jgi:hypothetical protein
MLTKEEWEGWVDHPGTREVRRALRLRLRSGQTEWSSGGFQADTIEKTALLNAEAVGMYRAITGFVEMTFEDYLTYAEEDSEE